MLPTVAEILTLDSVRPGWPRAVAGLDALSNPVRWVHVSDLPDIARLLRGGELILTTGLGFPERTRELVAYVRGLVDAGVSGLLVELGRRYATNLPAEMLHEATVQRLPVVVVEREIQFVRVTEEVHGRIIESQISDLRAAEEFHQIFTSLAVEGAPPGSVLGEVARITGRPAIFEDLSHQVLAVAPAHERTSALLSSWEVRSRRAVARDRSTFDPVEGLLVTRVGARGREWGRLVVVCEEAPPDRWLQVVEAAATTLALGRLIEHDEDNLKRLAHRHVLAAILARSYSDEEVLSRAAALRVPLTKRQLVGITMLAVGQDRADGTPGMVQRLSEQVVRATDEARIPALVGVLDEAAVGVLLSISGRTPVEPILDQLAASAHAAFGPGLVIGVGSVAQGLQEGRRSLRESREVSDAVEHGATGQSYYRLPDLGIRGLLYVLRGDTRMQTFVERELGALLEYDARHATQLLPVLRAYLAHGASKATAASALHISRPALYDRLEHLEQVLGRSLDDAERRLSLHVAILSLSTLRTSRATSDVL
jgi:purine catabolism regulator